MQSDYTFSRLTTPLDLHANNLLRTPTFRDYTAFTTSVKTIYWASWRTGQQPQPREEWQRLFLQTPTKRQNHNSSTENGCKHLKTIRLSCTRTVSNSPTVQLAVDGQSTIVGTSNSTCSPRENVISVVGLRCSTPNYTLCRKQSPPYSLPLCHALQYSSPLTTKPRSTPFSSTSTTMSMHDELRKSLENSNSWAGGSPLCGAPATVTSGGMNGLIHLLSWEHPPPHHANLH